MWRKISNQQGCRLFCKAAFISLLLLTCRTARAQVDSCQERLIQASQLYEKGKLSQVIQTLGNCLYNHDESRATRRNVLNMAAESFIFMDSVRLAQRTLLELLRLDPFYKVNKDIPEMRYLREQVVTYPCVEIITFFGSNLLTRADFQSAVVYSGATLISRKYSPKGIDGDFDTSLGFLGGFDIGIALDKRSNFDIHFGLNLSRFAFGHIQEMDNVLNFNNQLDRASLFVAEKHLRIQAPLYLSFNLVPRESIVERHLIPYLKIGASYDHLLRQTAKLSSLKLSFPPSDTSSVNPGTRIGDYRQSSNFSILAGAGVKLHLHRFFLLLDAQYSQMLRNLRDTEANRLSIDGYRYVDNDFTLSNFSLRLGFGVFLFRAKVK
jgi:hypothetical protein